MPKKAEDVDKKTSKLLDSFEIEANQRNRGMGKNFIKFGKSLKYNMKK